MIRACACVLVFVTATSIAFDKVRLHTQPKAPALQTDRDRAELRGFVHTVSVRWQANHKDKYGDTDERLLGGTEYDRDGNKMVEHEITPDFARDRIPERHGRAETVIRSKLG